MAKTPRDFQAVIIARAIEFYLSTGQQVNTAYTPEAMLRTANTILQPEQPLTELPKAAEALHTWANR